MTGIFWLEQRLCDLPPGSEWLAPAEAARLGDMRFERRRDDFRLGRWVAKQALVAYLGLPGGSAALARIEIRAAPDGVPEPFIDGRPAGVSLSLSHRAGVGFCSVAPYGAQLGCDVEVVEPRASTFVEDYFTPEEQELVCRAEAAARDRLVTLLWSAKESVLKALGAGLRRVATSVRVHPAGSEIGGPPAWQRLCAHTPDGGIFHGWYREAGGLLRTIAVAVPAGRCLFQA